MRSVSSLALMMRNVGGLIVIALFLAQLAVVALRYVFSTGSPWALDLLVYCFFVASVLPLLFVLLTNVSVRVDIFYTGWPSARRNMLDRISLGALLCPSMAYAAWSMWGPTVRSWRIFETTATYGGLPGLFVLKTVLLAGFALLAVFAGWLALKPSPYATGKEEA